MTEIYSKRTASFQYLHRTSYHPPHTFRSILRSQFSRIRRICSDINDYWSHSKRFTNFFKSRGFNRMVIDKISEKISKIPRHDLFNNNNPKTPINQLLQTEKTSRIPAPKTIWISVNPPPSLSRNGQRLSRTEMWFSCSIQFSLLS